MKKLQCVIHAPSSNTLLMKQKVTEALIAKTSNLEISISNPFETNAKDILEADGLLIGTTENLASMAGATKDFFDRNKINIETKLINNCGHHIPVEASSLALNFFKKNLES